MKTDRELLEKKAREICTYYSDDPLGGTSGYCLSEDQFKKLFSLFDEEMEKEDKKIVAMLAVEVMKTETMNNHNINDFNQAHVHGIRRAIYLINTKAHLSQSQEEEKK